MEDQRGTWADCFVSDRDGNPEIYILDDYGSYPVRLTYNPAGDFNPAWSPDGTQIAFYSERDGNAEIYVINADGSGEAQRLTLQRTTIPPGLQMGNRLRFTLTATLAPGGYLS